MISQHHGRSEMSRLKNIFPILPILMLTLTYIATYFLVLKGTAAYIIPSVLWVFTFILAYPYRRSSTLSSFQFKVIVASLAAFSIVANFVGGLATNLGKTPYTLEPIPLVFNLFYGVSRALAFEYTRGIIVAKFLKGKNGIGIVLRFIVISSFFTLLILNPYRVLGLENAIEAIKFLNMTVFPVFIENILLTQIVYMSNPSTSLIYRLVKIGFLYTSPILPDLPWTLKSTLNIAVVLISLIVLGSLDTTKRFTGLSREDRIDLKGYLWVIPVIILLLLFSGFFGVKPYVVVSGSMEPTLNIGDIVFIGKTSFNDVKVSDIVAYYDGNNIVVHRVVKIKNDDGKVTLKLKGDANDNIDPIDVTKELFIGSVVFKVPKLGLVPIYLSNFIKSFNLWS